MKNLFIVIIIFLLNQNKTFACCEADDRTLTEMLFQGKVGTIFSCKILTMTVPKYENNFTITSSDGSIDGTATAQIIKVFFGKIDTSIVTLKTGSQLVIGASYLIYSAGSGRVFGCGGNCDQRMHQLTNSAEDLNELKLLVQFADIFKNKKSGKYTFLSSTNKILAVGEYKKGSPVNIWKHYFANGNLKTEQDLKSKHSKFYNSDGIILIDNIEYKDSTVSLTYSKGQLTYRWVTIPNEKGSILIGYEYFENGNLKLLEGQQNISVKGGGTTCEGKIGKYIEGFENGKIKLTGEYNKSKRIGLWKWYNEDGSFNAQVDYKDGTAVQ